MTLLPDRDAVAIREAGGGDRAGFQQFASPAERHSPQPGREVTQYSSSHHPSEITAPPACGHCTTHVRALHHPSAVTAPPKCGHCTTHVRSPHHPIAVTAPPKCGHSTAQVQSLHRPSAYSQYPPCDDPPARRAARWSTSCRTRSRRSERQGFPHVRLST
jgi:hypothetical protein